jgi:hypothetical protein
MANEINPTDSDKIWKGWVDIGLGRNYKNNKIENNLFS